MDMFSRDIENDTGIVRTLQGDVQEKTAYQTQVARESSLRRLRIPLEAIAEALEDDAYLTLSLIEQVYSVTEVVQLTSQEQITNYLKEINYDQSLYNQYDDEETGEKVFEAKVPREIPLNVSQDANGELVESKSAQFFRVSPDSLKWEGSIVIKPQSIINQSKELQKQMNLELFNLVMPMLNQSLVAKSATMPGPEVPTVDPKSGMQVMMPGAPVPNPQAARDYIDTVIKPLKNIW